ncbi:hypothetical protein [Actinotignum sp. GS-2025d]|uniref:hypothetical protein n=1 Tax=Actinotignum sp. GS-2025d TaxID=3427277 RepID=UPI003F44A2CD
MGVIRGVTEEDILAFLREHGIEAGANYLVVRKYRSFLGGIGKLLVSNLWNAIDAAVIRVLVVTDAEFIVINPEGKSGLSNIWVNRQMVGLISGVCPAIATKSRPY